jgi:uncharacterized Zn finger protein
MADSVVCPHCSKEGGLQVKKLITDSPDDVFVETRCVHCGSLWLVPEWQQNRDVQSKGFAKFRLWRPFRHGSDVDTTVVHSSPASTPRFCPRCPDPERGLLEILEPFADPYAWFRCGKCGDVYLRVVSPSFVQESGVDTRPNTEIGGRR